VATLQIASGWRSRYRDVPATFANIVGSIARLSALLGDFSENKSKRTEAQCAPKSVSAKT
jgi:hypothetical protein